MATDIVKRHGGRPNEQYHHDKLRSSIQAACLSVRCPIGLAEDTATIVCTHVAHWLEEKPEVTSADLRRVAAAILARYHADAAYMYQNHRLMI